MTITLLLDLDNTLLHNNTEIFIPEYLKALSRYLEDHIDPVKLKKALLAATDVMAANNRLDRSLKQTFDEVFYPAIGYEEHQLTETLNNFNSQKFSSLQKFTSPIPAAVTLVKKAVERGYRVAIATNPLFPLTAIIQRLEWSGLPADEYPFALIPSYETFHFAKPNPAFFAEFLAQLGWEEGPVIMVGDDMINDIEPARSLGICTVWIKNGRNVGQINSTPTVTLEEISQFLPWLDATPQDPLEPNFSSPSALLPILKSTPAALLTICNQIDKLLWNKRIQADEWCITEILCHLRDVDAEVNLPRVEAVLSEDNPFLAGKDTDPWANERQYINQDGDQAMNSFIQARTRIVDYLEKIQPAAWQRSARHAIFGPTRLIELVNIIAGHDRLHIQQVYKNLHAYTSK